MQPKLEKLACTLLVQRSFKIGDEIFRREDDTLKAHEYTQFSLGVLLVGHSEHHFSVTQ